MEWCVVRCLFGGGWHCAKGKESENEDFSIFKDTLFRLESVGIEYWLEKHSNQPLVSQSFVRKVFYFGYLFL